MVPLVSVSSAWSTPQPDLVAGDRLAGDQVGVDELAREAPAHAA